MAAFSRQAIQMTWDFAEMNTHLEGSGSFGNAVDWTAETVETLGVGGSQSSIANLDAAKNNYPMRPVLISSDPPYYDNIGYADLSDFFYVWLKRALGSIWPDLFRRLITPKPKSLSPHLIATAARPRRRLFYEGHGKCADRHAECCN
jgi:putative DNA methylase